MSYRRYIVAGWIITIALCWAAVFWLFDGVGDNQTASNAQPEIFGEYEGYMDVESESPVCVLGISEAEFEITTPSGVFRPTTQLGKYFFGEGCYIPGRWEFTGGAPAMKLSSESAFKATSVTPSRVKSIPWVFGLVMTLATSAVYGAILWQPKRQER